MKLAKGRHLSWCFGLKLLKNNVSTINSKTPLYPPYSMAKQRFHEIITNVGCREYIKLDSARQRQGWVKIATLTTLYWPSSAPRWRATGYQISLLSPKKTRKTGASPKPMSLIVWWPADFFNLILQIWLARALLKLGLRRAFWICKI